jgi:hypothetical protein
MPTNARFAKLADIELSEAIAFAVGSDEAVTGANGGAACSTGRCACVAGELSCTDVCEHAAQR